MVVAINKGINTINTNASKRGCESACLKLEKHATKINAQSTNITDHYSLYESNTLIPLLFMLNFYIKLRM